MLHLYPPQNELELIKLAQQIEGLTFQQLALYLNQPLPLNPTKRKGWVGQAVEKALGAPAGSKPLPDFSHLNIELKTIPLNHLGAPAESTFITSIALQTIHQEQWRTSQCYTKLQRILWVPVEGDDRIPFLHRRIGRARLWSPDAEDEAVLAQDWQELVNMIVLGELESIHAGLGTYLQIRPKAAHSKIICYAYDAEGNLAPTLPRGFYLRAAFTKKIFVMDNSQ